MKRSDMDVNEHKIKHVKYFFLFVAKYNYINQIKEVKTVGADNESCRCIHDISYKIRLKEKISKIYS
jgi:hypothetical protein